MKFKFFNLFVFFLAFPSVKIFGLSITLYLFVFFLISIEKFEISSKTLIYKLMFLSFLISQFSSSFIDEIDNQVFFKICLKFIKYGYWFMIALFFENNLNSNYYFNFKKYIYYGLLLSIFTYYFFNFNLDFGLISLSHIKSRNDFIFYFMCCFPFAYYYLEDINKPKIFKYTFVLICFLAVSFSNGRTGFILFIFELIVINLFKKNKNPLFYFRYIIIFLSLLLLGTLFKSNISNLIRPLSPRTADIIISKNEGDFTNDKSLMLRLLMVDKGMEIFYDYPLLGIGPGNFINYNSKMKGLEKYDRLYYSESNKYYDTRSSHNTYIEILSELGILGSFLFLIYFLQSFSNFFKNLFNIRMNLVYVSFITMLFYFPFISALTGSIAWVIFGIVRSKFFININNELYSTDNKI